MRELIFNVLSMFFSVFIKLNIKRIKFPLWAIKRLPILNILLTLKSGNA